MHIDKEETVLRTLPLHEKLVFEAIISSDKNNLRFEEELLPLYNSLADRSGVDKLPPCCGDENDSSAAATDNGLW